MVKDVNRLVIVDREERVEGVVTVSDLIDYVVLRHVVDTTAGERHASLSSPPSLAVSDGRGGPCKRLTLV